MFTNNHFGPDKPRPIDRRNPRNTPPNTNPVDVMPQTASDLVVAMNAAIAAKDENKFNELHAYGVQQGWIKEAGGLPADVEPGVYPCIAASDMETKLSNNKGTVYSTVSLDSDDGLLTGFNNFCTKGTFILANDAVNLTVVETEIGQYSPYGTTTLATTMADVNAA